MENSLDYTRIEKAIQFIREEYHNQPTLDQIADHVHLSKFHFQRMFQHWVGVTPKGFVQYLTAEHAKKLLREGQSNLCTSHDLGLSGTGRLHDLFIKLESVTPGEFKTKGKSIAIRYGFYPTVFGEVLLAETNLGICDLQFITHRSDAFSDLQKKWQNATLVEQNTAHSRDFLSFLNELESPKKKIALHVNGTPFQIKVWEALLKIPMGNLVAYGDIAKMIRKPNATRAVGTAIGKNPVAFLIPCHRVIRQAGEIGQYRWGSERKRNIIGYESVKTTVS